MKRFICGILAGTMLMCLASCGAKSGETDSTVKERITEESEEDTEESVEEKSETTSDTEPAGETDGEGWHFGYYYGKPWYVDDKSAGEIADIAYSYVTNEPKIGMTSEEYYSSFAYDNDADRSQSAWSERTNEFEGKGKPVTSEGFSYGYIDDVDTAKCSIRGITLENLWVDENFRYAGSAYENIGDDYGWSSGKRVVLTTTVFAPTEELAREIYDAYLEKYGAGFGYDANVQPESVGFAFDLILSACSSRGDYIATIQHRTSDGRDYYELTFFKYF